MQVTAEKDKVIADMIFGDIYPYLRKKVRKKAGLKQNSCRL